MKAIKEGFGLVKVWASSHPWKLATTTFVLGVLTNPSYPEWPAIALLAVVASVFALDSCAKKVALWFLAGSILCQAAAANEVPVQHPVPMPQGGTGIAIGVVVVVTGGYLIYKMVRFCQRHFNPPPAGTNAPPDGEQASYFATGPGSCVIPADVETEDDHATHMQISVSPTGIMSAEYVPLAATIDIQQLRAALAGCPESETVSLGIGWVDWEPDWAEPDEYQDIEVQFSNNLETWEPIVRARYPKGLALIVDDVQDLPETYYRAIAK